MVSSYKVSDKIFGCISYIFRGWYILRMQNYYFSTQTQNKSTTFGMQFKRRNAYPYKVFALQMEYVVCLMLVYSICGHGRTK
jgi:hypothetical protein